MFCFISFLNTCFGCFVFWLSMDVGTLNPQNVASYIVKTDSCLKLRFLNQHENVMISGSILALFCYHLSWFSWVISLPVVSMFFNDLWHRCWLHFGTLFGIHWPPFHILGLDFIVPVLWKIICGGAFFILVPFRLRFCFLLAPIWFPFGSLWFPFSSLSHLVMEL